MGCIWFRNRAIILRIHWYVFESQVDVLRNPTAQISGSILLDQTDLHGIQTWKLSRKLRLLLVSCLAAFAGNVAALSGQEAYPIQASVYKVTVLESSYSVRY